ncbi:phosphoribosylglycinamide formyltransferase 2 [Peribacillus frigoritolerans]|jgi:phosphoribosylglycinamide formyltransferase 2|uniref:phosphoribosylglycinamide formyltransferase 2 n=1 Tax=Peribacillus frigoritolerans TaxID=450367 RepID=UPI000BEC0AB4|nr:phosphoribosylglycinamide formyltransferase 2 [Peribacillus frigoritolerans]PEF34500.1 phosphoribosylglycinamide formyltransferase 2 [Bacillus sp. AFS094228]PEO43916.1 phosphoribosylglycinamide formyltransferase 2 [Bacillus sp. AFS026049]MCR8868939.1 phosphoribosylglycinamide formyltransferase 2 [Peribacillus frigoritolerans]MCY9005554.1 phosphoribosylglycinamide formyltransferase 2 [Peribacillus frigoritolerans]MED4697404.1 phosphoribosylglycinamide formyltransferase 2 [Peribacillus frigor
MYKSKKILLLGSGELGKEVILEAQRLGVETVAVDRYEHAPAMQVAHRSYVIDMLDAEQLRGVVEKEQPDLIVPEIEAIATSELVKLEEEGFQVIPTARAAKLTMDREGIRRLASETLEIPTAAYKFANTYEEFVQAAKEVGFPNVVKPLMSSSGKGQSVCRTEGDLEDCWKIAMEGGRVQNGRVIIEEFIRFDSEITLLTVRAVNGTMFCAPIGHIQQGGDYIESWQPHNMTEAQIMEAKRIAHAITDELGGYGLFGVELFLSGDKVYFSEVSPRPHDTGLVTLVTQNLSEFALHIRAILGFPIPEIKLISPGASRPLKAQDELSEYSIVGVEQALALPNTQVRLFGKPVTKAGRRVAVALSSADSIEVARVNAARALECLVVEKE